MSLTPFVVGQWVRGEKFYGRSVLIDEIIKGHRNWLWLLGTRRIGKTSLLKQLEHITATTKEYRYFPIFWDFQGADDPEELHAGFSDALLDAEDRLEEIGIDPEDVEADDLFRSLGRLRRKIRSKDLKLLLLCDEVEELIKLNQKDPTLLRKLRRAMQSHEDIRSVLASTIRLWALSEQYEDTSPFLHGFTPPLYIHSLADDEARALIMQANLPTDSRPRFDDETVETIRSHCDNHPYLIQLVSKRFLELENLEEAIEQVATDPMVSYFFSVDFEMLSEEQRNIIRIIAERTSSTSASIQDNLRVESDHLSGTLHGLEHLGYIRRNEQRRYMLVNYFFRRWFKEQPGAPDMSGSSPSWQPTVRLRTDQTTVTDGIKPDLFGDRYEVLEQAGKGASGIIYKARDKMLDVDIAIKLLKREYSSNPEALERFRQEIVLSRDIAHHNILRVYHLGDHNGMKYLTMQWVGGPSLAQLIADEAPLELGRVLAIAKKTVSAVEALHGAGVIHRDIKPHNILLSRTDEPYLTDFGLVRELGSEGMTRQGVFLGTPDYCSPEQAKLLPLDERSDLYALGLVIFEMATGRRPFPARSSSEALEMHKHNPPPVPSELQPSIPSDLSNLILRCLEKDPDKRFGSAAELRRALEKM